MTEKLYLSWCLCQKSHKKIPHRIYLCSRKKGIKLQCVSCRRIKLKWHRDISKLEKVGEEIK